ncbi:MAG: hypothetical protein Q7R49_06740 [Candidatus Daviesbacteria bacterium]|nr:hypothetical protein [Candidatus Daviesbacteria bacterium]
MIIIETGNPELERHIREITRLINEAPAAAVIFRRRLTPGAIVIAPFYETGSGPFGGFFNTSSIPLSEYFSQIGEEEKLKDIFEEKIDDGQRTITETDEEGNKVPKMVSLAEDDPSFPKKVLSSFKQDGKQQLANLLGKRVEFMIQESGMDPAGQTQVPDDSNERTKKLLRMHPYSTGTWLPEKAA